MDPLLASFKLACFTGEFYSDGVKVVIVKISRVRDVVLDYEQLPWGTGWHSSVLQQCFTEMMEMPMNQGQEGWWRKGTENAGAARRTLKVKDIEE